MQMAQLVSGVIKYNGTLVGEEDVHAINQRLLIKAEGLVEHAAANEIN